MSERPMFRDLGLTYEEAAHGVQTAIKFRIMRQCGPNMMHAITPESFVGPKHLRVGVNMRAADAAGLARLLIDKGVFTEEEYVEFIRLAANEELAREQDELGVTFR